MTETKQPESQADYWALSYYAIGAVLLAQGVAPPLADSVGISTTLGAAVGGGVGVLLGGAAYRLVEKRSTIAKGVGIVGLIAVAFAIMMLAL